MKTRNLKVSVWILIGLVLGFGLGFPGLLLPNWSPLGRMAVSAGGQLVAYALMAALAVGMESQGGWGDHHDEPPPPSPS
jgi:polyferredoxin